MTGRLGEATGRLLREQARERHERAVELVDVEAVRRALSGCPSVLGAMTDLERELVVTIADVGGLSREVTARGLGLSKSGLDWAVKRRREHVAELDRDLRAAAALRPAADLVDAVASRDAEAVADLLCALDRQRLAALAVVLAGAVRDPSLIARMPIPDHAAM